MLLKTENLTRTIQGDYPTTLVENINIAIQENEFVAITGPSGSGKSSLLYLLGLLDQPTSGKIWLLNQEMSFLSEKDLALQRLSHIGFVFQFHFLLAELTALDNVLLPMQRYGKLSSIQMNQRAYELLSLFEMQYHATKHPAQLSGGQRQRVAIARALANEPALILADEPTGSLDSKSSQNVRSIFEELVKKRVCSIVTVTHDEMFAHGADREIHLLDGKIMD